MKDSEYLIMLAPALAAGLLIGVVFFGGLWWTVKKGLSSSKPALWFAISLLIRLGIVVGGFYLVAGGSWQRLLACVAGFTAARFLILRMTRPVVAGQHRRD